MCCFDNLNQSHVEFRLSHMHISLCLNNPSTSIYFPHILTVLNSVLCPNAQLFLCLQRPLFNKLIRSQSIKHDGSQTQKQTWI